LPEHASQDPLAGGVAGRRSAHRQPVRTRRDGRLLRALDQSQTQRVDGVIVRPYHPYTKSTELPVADGKVDEVWIEVFPTAASFAPGDSLRLSIQPSDAPHLSPTLPQAQSSVGGVLTVLHDAAHPSEVVLPVAG
jgi:predicted acyl esterase